jgi:type I restriction enzyme S subunit
MGRVSGGLTKNSKRASLQRLVPYLRVANVYADCLSLSNVESIGVADSELDRVLLRRNDLLIVEGNGSRDQIGRAALWTGEIDPCVHQNHLIKARFADESIARWALIWLLAPQGRHEVEAQASSTSGLHTLSISKISSITLPLPPKREIEVILEELSDYRQSDSDLDLVTSRQEASANLLRQTALAAAFCGKLVQ